jgi:hypothetical protein
MNFIGLTPAADAANPLTLPNARLRVKAKVSHPARVLTYLSKGLDFMKVKLSVVLISIAAIVVGSSVAFSDNDQNKGAKSIEIDGGQKGNVPFPHRQHQERLVDCKICHSVFPQKPGSIKELKAQGKLQKKSVMNKLCTKCHKETKKAGLKTGPLTCSKCHVKAKS